MGVARQPLSAAARGLARELACTVTSGGDGDADPCLVAVADPLAAARPLRTAVEYSPRAAMSLARLLRVASAVPVPDALAAESAVYSMLLASGEFARWLAGPGPAPGPGGGRRPARPSW